MRNNILTPLKRISNSNDDGLVEKMRSRLERHTKYWPMTISSTLMFNLKQVCNKIITFPRRVKHTIFIFISNNN